MLGLGGRSILLGSGLWGGLRSRSRLGLLRLLGGDVGQLGGVEKLERLGNVTVDRLVVDSLVPSSDVGVLSTPLLVVEELEAAGDDASGKQISEGDALANQVGVVKEVLLYDINNLSSTLSCLVNVLLVVLVPAKERAVPSTELRENLGVEE